MTLLGIRVEVISLLVAIVLGFLNYLYTKRRFESLAHPYLRSHISIAGNTIGRPIGPHRNYESRITLEIENHSSSISVAECEYRVYVFIPGFFRRLLMKSWILIEQETISTISPSRKRPIQLNRSIELALEEGAPHLIQRINLNEENGTGTWYYHFPMADELRLKVVLHYKPGIVASRSKKTKEYFALAGREVRIESHPSMTRWEQISKLGQPAF
jgi:hypothetical protein